MKRTLDPDKIVRSCRQRRTKRQLVKVLHLSYATISTGVNVLVKSGALVADGKLETGKRGRPQVYYKAA